MKIQRRGKRCLSCCEVYHREKLFLQSVRFRPVFLAAEPVSGQDEVVHTLCVDDDGSVIDASVDTSSAKTIVWPLSLAGHSVSVAIVWNISSTALAVPTSVP